MNKKNQMLANKMVRVAKSLMALSADDEAKVMVDYKAFVDGKKKFEDAHKDLLKQANDLQKQIDELEEQKKALEATLKGEFKIFDKEVGITKTAKAAAGTLAVERKVEEREETGVAGEVVTHGNPDGEGES